MTASGITGSTRLAPRQAAPAPTAATESPLAALQSRLRDATHWDAEYGQHDSNHLPVALAALHRLGASTARLDAFSAHYATRLHPAPPAQPWPAGDPWRGRFGDAWAWPAYRHFFRHWLGHEGGADVLNQALPWLMAGCGAAAFHGLIRTAYAFEAVAPEELADALAYWACRWLDLGAAPDSPPAARRPARAVHAPARDPAKLAPALAALPRSRAPVIVLRMLDAARRRGFGAAVAPLQIDAQTLPRLARQAAQRYARSGNFTVLHQVTSAHALRVLLPFIDDSTPAIAAYWRAYAAAGVAAGDAAALTAGRAAALIDWPDIVQAAIASDDDHLVKLVDACRQEQAAYGGAPDWQRAASRAVADAARRGGATRASGVVAA